MKLTVNQFNSKRRYYAVWFPLCNTVRYKSCKWYHVDTVDFVHICEKNSFIISSLSDIVLSEYQDIYIYFITVAKRKVEYNGCLNFLLSCTPTMLDRFAVTVMQVYPCMFTDKHEVLNEISEIIWPFKTHY